MPNRFSAACRDREIQCSGGYANLALRSLDALKEMLSTIDGFPIGAPISLPADYGELRRVLENPEANGITGRSELAATLEDDTRGDFEGHAIPIGEILADMGKITIEQLKAVLDKKGNRLTGEVLIHEGLVTLEDVTEALGKQKAADIKRAASSESTVRVRTERLDRLIDIVGELVIAQSMLTQDSTVMQGTHHELSRKISHAGKIVRDLQDLSMGMRMVPLKSTFQKMTRLVRDVAQKCGKQVEFITVGEDTEIDRNMVDLISDPLVHMVRNAADHGIELPSVRLAAGKPLAGKIRLAAYHSGGDVVVELKDDGKGIDRDAVVAKAIANGLIESEKGMTEDQIYNLILAPGFSTAAEVTAVSGRGVGMDVVKRNIEAMRGRISISSEKGGGTLFTIRLPLTLAITDGMLIRIGAEKFIIPIVNIQISFQPSESMLSSIAGRGELVSLRGELMPIFRLHRLFDVKDAIEDPTQGLLMIVADGRKRCALLVDELLGQQQVVAKNLGEGMGKIQGVSGGAILGDGCVGLILDTPELVAMARENGTQNINKDDSKPQKAA
ncbi:MAG: chemotaxis protein CheW [Pyrinomonadaceae bacterium]